MWIQAKDGEMAPNIYSLLIRKTPVIVEMLQLSFPAFVCVFCLEISSFFQWEFPLSLPIFCFMHTFLSMWWLITEFVITGFLGLHIQMDKWLFNSSDWSSFLSSILQFPVHALVESSPAQNSWAITELWGHPHELPGVTCHKTTSHQGDTT